MAGKLNILSDVLVYPFINQEDLKTSRSLLMSINVRGRHSSHTFAMTESNFLFTVRASHYDNLWFKMDSSCIGN